MTEAGFADLIGFVAPHTRLIPHNHQMRAVELCTKLFGQDFMQFSTFNDIRNRRISGRWTWTPTKSEVMVCFVSPSDAETFDRMMP